MIATPHFVSRLAAPVRSAVRTLGAALLLCLALVRPAAAVDWTDIWWATPEVGWGVNFVQSNTFIFATFFVHGPDLQPDWYTGEMTVDVAGVWSGPLYRTTGSYFGTTWSGSQTSTVRVGTVTFKPETAHNGLLTYNVNNVNVSKQISRLTLTPIPIGGKYFGGIYNEIYNCTNTTFNAVNRSYSVVEVGQSTVAAGAQMQLTFSIGSDACTLTGTYVQDGRQYRVPNAAYVCSSGINTVATVSQITATAQGIEGQWIAGLNGNCVDTGFFSAVLY